MTRTQILLVRFALLATVLAAWEYMPRAGIVHSLLLPPLTEVLAMLGDLLGRTSVQEALATTAAEVIVAFIIAVPLGAAAGIIVAENDYIGAIFRPMLFYVFSIPKSIFLPMFILAFGIGFWQKVAFGVFSTIFIVMMTAFAAVASVREDHLTVARSYGATSSQVVLRVYVPSMTPVLLEAVRLAMIFNFTGIMLAEMYASRQGVGNVIGSWGQSFQLNQLLAAVVLVSVLAILFNEAVRHLERRFEHWRG